MSDKKSAVCSQCQQEKAGVFKKSMCNACYQKSNKVTATCIDCKETKFSTFVSGRCTKCYKKSRVKKAKCAECKKVKTELFVSGLCSSCRRNQRKVTGTCATCKKTKTDVFTKGICNACKMQSRKTKKTCSDCGETKTDFFIKGRCRACDWNARQQTAVCKECGELKEGTFTLGMCSSCYHQKSKTTQTCVECGFTKTDTFTRGMCGACTSSKRKREDVCLGCGKIKLATFTSGYCPACLRKARKITSLCIECGEESFGIFTNGLCRTCYRKQMKTTAQCVVCGEEKYDIFTKDKLCQSCDSKRPERVQVRLERLKNQRETDELFRLTSNLRTAVWRALGGRKFDQNTEMLTGQSFDEFLADQIAKIPNGYSISDLGTNALHSGHIIPVSLCKLMLGREGVCLSWNHRNIRPQPSTENVEMQDSIWWDALLIDPVARVYGSDLFKKSAKSAQDLHDMQAAEMLRLVGSTIQAYGTKKMPSGLTPDGVTRMAFEAALSLSKKTLANPNKRRRKRLNPSGSRATKRIVDERIGTE